MSTSNIGPMTTDTGVSSDNPVANDAHVNPDDPDTMPNVGMKYVLKYRQEHTVLPEICSKMVVYHVTIVPCDETKYHVKNKRISYDTQLSDALTPEEYVCFRDLLMNIVPKKERNIDGNHTIEVSHSVDH